MRRVVLTLSGLTAAAVVLLTTAPTAFALRYAPPPSSGASATGTPVAAAAVQHGGLSPWEVALIVVGGLVVLTAVVVGSMVRASHRSRPTPAMR